jgi:thioredoxin-dependent peroxiredoxin
MSAITPSPFELPDHRGGTFKLEPAPGRPLVIFFYPKDESSACTAEVCSFRDAMSELTAAGVEVVGISSDDLASHKRFAEKHQLPYRLLSDDGGRVRTEWGVPRALFGAMDGRTTYVLDRDGVIVQRHVVLLRTSKHIESALAGIRALATGVPAAAHSCCQRFGRIARRAPASRSARRACRGSRWSA